MALSTSSVSVGTVKTALGTSENGVIALCKSNKCNKWSGTKPFQSSTSRFTYSELVAALKAANFGLTMTGYSTAAAALAAAAGGSELWPHAKPAGTSSQPCRLGDYRGYNHNAPVPYSSGVTPVPGTTGSANAAFEFDVDQASGAEVLASQANAIKNGKWVLLWRKTTGTAASVNGANVSSATFPFSLTVQDLADAGTYEACAAIYANSQYYPVPNTYKSFQITFVAPSLAVAWNVCAWNAAMTEVSFEIAILNSSNSAQQFAAHTVTLRETTGTPQSGVQPSGSSPASFTTTAVTVPANGSAVIKTGKFTGITYNQNKQYYVILSGTQITYEYTAIEEPEPEEI
jgi:hypothetical protein